MTTPDTFGRALLRGVLATLFLVASLATADDTSTSPNEPTKTEKTEEVDVRAEAPTSDTVELDAAALRATGAHNIALALETAPGVSCVRRAAGVGEPVVRGLGWERVQTQLDGMPLYGACPARMDPPASGLGTALIESAGVVKGLASVSLGPAGTGGRVLASAAAAPPAGREPQTQGHAELGFDSARDGLTGSLALRGGSKSLAYRVALEASDADGYTSPDGRAVPAGEATRGAAVSFAFAPSERQSLVVSLLGTRAEDVDYPALPMDTDDAETRLAQVAYRLTPGGLVDHFELKLGRARNEHLMSNRRKPNRMMMHAETESIANSTSARAEALLRPGSGRLELLLGADFTDLDRSALRTRRMVMSGATFTDPLWPDAVQRDLGVFAESRFALDPRSSLRAGFRYDRVSSDARAADAVGLGGLSVREHYIRFYGPEAGDVDREETLRSGNLLFERQLVGGLSAHAGVGIVERAASVTERYFSFAPAPGGFQVGNPALEAERKRELVAGIRWTHAAASGGLSVFASRFDDYVLPTVLARQDVNGDGVPDTIRGFVGVSARMFGAEADVSIRLGSGWTLPASLAWVRGTNTTDDRPLPELPPLELRAALRKSWAGRLPGSAELGVRAASAQERIDAAFGEDETPGFAVWHLRSRIVIAGRLEISAAVENLFDKLYNEHLTREVMLPVGGLGKGDELPAMGRHFRFSLGYRF